MHENEDKFAKEAVLIPHMILECCLIAANTVNAFKTFITKYSDHQQYTSRLQGLNALIWQWRYMHLYSTQWVSLRWHQIQLHVDGLMQERRISSANVLELRLSCTNPSMLNTTRKVLWAFVNNWTLVQDRTIGGTVQSSRMNFMLRLPNCTDKHQMLIILTNPMSDIWILRLTKQTCWRDFGKTAVYHYICNNHILLYQDIIVKDHGAATKRPTGNNHIIHWIIKLPAKQKQWDLGFKSLVCM